MKGSQTVRVYFRFGCSQHGAGEGSVTCRPGGGLGRRRWLVLGQFAPPHDAATWTQAICSPLASREVISVWRCLAEISAVCAVPRF